MADFYEQIDINNDELREREEKEKSNMNKFKYEIRESKFAKHIISEKYNYIFNKRTGHFMRWGETMKDDPQYSPVGPEIADIEIVDGECSGNCKHCYKSNNKDLPIRYMTFENFKTIFHKLPRSLTQIAFGITDIDSNPDFKKIVEYCRNNDYQTVIPNVTINGNKMNSEWYDFLAENMGAVSVSHYSDDVCFNAIKELTDRGMTQVNIHSLLSEETFDKCYSLLDKKMNDPRLSKMNAIVFLSLKEKGEKNNLHPLTDFSKYSDLISKAMDNQIGIGFDSCGSSKFEKWINENPKYENLRQYIEPCESTLFSLYLNTMGKFYPCSFIEDEKNWEDGMDVLNCEDFMKDIWNNERVESFREKLFDKNRNCPYFNV